MPRNVATPEQAAAAKSQTDAIQRENSFRNMRPLSKMERRVVSEAKREIYIYNVSPVWEWVDRPVPGRGRITIPRRKPGERAACAVPVPEALIRDYDAGNRNRQQYVLEGIEVVQDVLGCSEDIPGLPQNDLRNYGCFYIVGKRLEDLPEEEQETLLFEAEEKHKRKCFEFTQNADQMWANPISKGWISPPYRLAAMHIAETYPEEKEDIYRREWVSIRGRSKPAKKVEECRFCGNENKPNLAVCPNCKNVLDQEQFDRISSRRKA